MSNLESSTAHEGRGLPWYRCILCGAPVSIFDVEQGGCHKCGHGKLRPSNLSLWEKVKEIIRNPRILKYAGRK